MATVTIEIDQMTAALLQAKAATQGMSLETLLRSWAANTITTTEQTPTSTSLDQFMADLESLSEGTEHIPAMPISYNREDIYFDHD